MGPVVPSGAAEAGKLELRAKAIREKKAIPAS
jgi:hypothetical protein